jgi:hypothetical protein
VFRHVNLEPNKLLFPWIKLSVLNILNCLAFMLLEFSETSIIFCFSCRINDMVPVFQKLFSFWIRDNVVCNLPVFRKELPTICKYVHINMPYAEDMCRVQKCTVKAVHKSQFPVRYNSNWIRDVVFGQEFSECSYRPCIVMLFLST